MGDQPQAIRELNKGLRDGFEHQVLLGATGTGKTFTVASIIADQQRPTLVIAHNKTLGAQLYAEFKDFFPENAVEYFVSYYDYYQPEAYVPRHDLYIEKETDINEEIERLRLSATASVTARRDVIVVASVSCIYGIGNQGRDINAIWEEGALEDIPGVGKAIAEKTDELLRTGELRYYENLKSEIPIGLLEILKVGDVGPKKAARFWTELGITSVEELEASARNGELQKLSGMGAKSEARILESIEALKRRPTGRMSIGVALPIAEQLLGGSRLHRNRDLELHEFFQVFASVVGSCRLLRSVSLADSSRPRGRLGGALGSNARGRKAGCSHWQRRRPCPARASGSAPPDHISL